MRNRSVIMSDKLISNYNKISVNNKTDWLTEELLLTPLSPFSRLCLSSVSCPAQPGQQPPLAPLALGQRWEVPFSNWHSAPLPAPLPAPLVANVSQYTTNTGNGFSPIKWISGSTGCISINQCLPRCLPSYHHHLSTTHPQVRASLFSALKTCLRIACCCTLLLCHPWYHVSWLPFKGGDKSILINLLVKTFKQKPDLIFQQWRHAKLVQKSGSLLRPAPGRNLSKSVKK